MKRLTIPDENVIAEGLGLVVSVDAGGYHHISASGSSQKLMITPEISALLASAIRDARAPIIAQISDGRVCITRSVETPVVTVDFDVDGVDENDLLPVGRQSATVVVEMTDKPDPAFLADIAAAAQEKCEAAGFELFFGQAGTPPGVTRIAIDSYSTLPDVDDTPIYITVDATALLLIGRQLMHVVEESGLHAAQMKFDVKCSDEDVARQGVLIARQDGRLHFEFSDGQVPCRTSSFELADIASTYAAVGKTPDLLIGTTLIIGENRQDIADLIDDGDCTPAP